MDPDSPFLEQREIHCSKTAAGRMAVSGARDDPYFHYELLADDPGVHHFSEKGIFSQYDVAGPAVPQL